MAVLADGSTVYTPTEWVAGALVYAGENEEALNFVFSHISNFCL